MKKTGILMMVLVLTLSVLTGCGCRNSKPMPTTMPTTQPTQATTPSTQATTAPTTAPTQASTAPTIPEGNGPLSTDSTTSTDDTTAGDNSRGMIGGSNMPNQNGGAITGGTGSGSGITGSIS